MYSFQERTFAQGRRRYDRKQAGYGGQSKPIFRKKVKHIRWLFVWVLMQLDSTVMKCATHIIV